jgi:hypothetical protein
VLVEALLQDASFRRWRNCRFHDVLRARALPCRRPGMRPATGQADHEYGDQRHQTQAGCDQCAASPLGVLAGRVPASI